MRTVGRRPLVNLFWAIIYLAMAGLTMSIVPAVARGGEPQCRLLDFYCDWCGPCRAMRPTVDAIAAAGYAVERVNIDEDPARAGQYGVTKVPCFVAVVDGREIDRVVGAASYARLEAMIKAAGPSAMCANVGRRPSPAWRYERAVGHRSAVVRIYCQSGATSRSIGSGALVKWNGRLVVLTARHVIKGAEKIIVELCNGKRHAATVVKFDAVWDCAVLQLNGEPHGVEAAELELGGDAMQREGDRLESCGYGPDGKLACNSGLFLGYKRSAAAPSGPDDWLVISGHARGGDSGGPVFNERGRLVGVLWGTDGKEVVCVQAGRLHLLLDAAVPPGVEKTTKRSIEAGGAEGDRPIFATNADQRCASVPAVPAKIGTVPARTPTPAKQPENDAGVCQSGMNRAQPECLERLFGGRRQPAPNVVVQPDPEVRRALENIDGKVGVLIEQRRPAPIESADDSEPSPLLAGLCMLGAAVAGCVIYFATQR